MIHKCIKEKSIEKGITNAIRLLVLIIFDHITKSERMFCVFRSSSFSSLQIHNDIPHIQLELEE